MNRSYRTILVLAVAVLMAAIASFGVYRVVASAPARQQVETVNTVVASQPIKLGTRVTKDHVKVVSWPASSPIPGSFTTVEEVLNRGVITHVGENEPLTNSKLAPIGSGAGLPPSIPDGMRAISVKVNEVIGVAGFVVPGTRVDVMVTLSARAGLQTMTRVVVSNVTVLTAGTRIDQEKAKEGDAIPSTVVTLLVTPEDGERLALASTEGAIMLSLRNPIDTAPTVTSGVQIAGLFGKQTSSEPPTPRPASTQRARPVTPTVVVAPPAVPKYTVEAIRGAKRTEEVVR